MPSLSLAETDSVLITAILNLLAKAGMTGHLEVFFLLAKRLEAQSWDHRSLSSFLHTHRSSSAPPHQDAGAGPDMPLAVNIHAYTIMLQAYASERTKRGHIHGWSKEAHASGVLAPSLDHTSTRKSAALSTGHELYASVATAAAQIAQSLVSSTIGVQNSPMQISEDPSTSFALRKLADQIPTPDARFFNAALSLFARSSKTDRRSWPHSESRRLALLQRPSHHSPSAPSAMRQEALSMVKQDIEAFAFKLPDGLDRLLHTGSHPTESRSHDDRSRFHSPPTHPFRIPVSKTKGRPSRRRTKAP